MLKRLLRVIIYILCFPIIGITAYSIIITIPISIILYIIGKIKVDEILEVSTKYFMWTVMLPDLILKKIKTC